MLIDENDGDEAEDYEMKHHLMKKEVSCSDVKKHEDVKKQKKLKAMVPTMK